MAYLNSSKLGSTIYTRLRARIFCVLFPLGLMACLTPILAVDDAMELEDGRTRFVAFAEREEGLFFSGVEGVDVHFFVDGQPVASARSNKRGVAMTLATIGKGAERFEATATVSGKDFRRSGRVIQWRSQQVLIACDIDATISETSLEALFIGDDDLKSKPIPGSVETLQQIAENFGLIYFTARPRFTLAKTQRWLEAHGYPDGPVLTSLTLKDAIFEAAYKRREIRKLRETLPNLLIGFGNSFIDSEGYGANDMLSLILNPTGKAHHGRHSIEFESWEQIRIFFEVNQALLQDPEWLRLAAQGGAMILVPTLPWADAGRSR
jgi:hypothetical protein